MEQEPQYDSMDWAAQEKLARDWVVKIEKSGQNSLAAAKEGSFPKLDVEELEYAVNNLRSVFEQLLEGYVAYMQEDNPLGAANGYILVRELALCAFLVGSRGTWTDSQKVFFNKMQAALARSTRAESPRVRAIDAAIAAERGTRPVAQPAKEATAILDAVNRRLLLVRQKSVKVDVVRRRLEKFPRS